MEVDTDKIGQRGRRDGSIVAAMRRFGSIPGVSRGTSYADRRALYDAGVHRALIAGIVGGAKEGAESIVVSGGYEDDEDYGDILVYTGQGGNDPGDEKADGRPAVRQG